MRKELFGAVVAVSVVATMVGAGCGSSPNTGFAVDDAGPVGDAGTHTDGTIVPDDAGLVQNDGTVLIGSGDAAMAVTCNPTSLDLQGCLCPSVGTMRACYTGPAKTRDVGECKDGMQTCVGSETPQWGPCTGSVTPDPEVCNGNVDANCNGLTGCNDPTCTNTPYCNTGCTDGQTRKCYTGPTGTENFGVCKDGTQTCANGMWGMCTGEQLLEPVNCCDAIDHACNGVIGCFNLFQCITASCCQSSCDAGGGLDPGCVCMTGSGDTATCPQGTTYQHKGGLPGTDECCPCTANDCSSYNCCGESVCAGNSNCSQMTCNTLPSSCNGQVSADCDDFPEDCDEPCCECYPSVASGNSCP